MTETDGLLDRVSSTLDATATGATELHGGMVGTVYRVEFADRQPVAAKVDDAPLGVEAAMLQYLARESPLPVPTVHHVEPGLLVLEYVDGDGRFDERAERDLARHVAALHDVSADAYGFPFDTLSGPYAQSNPWTDSWIEFFRERRVLPFANAARDEGSLPVAEYDRVLAFADALDDLLVEPSAPSLLHGDVHPGNVVVESGEVDAVLDPAIYFGHDEVDLAYVARLDSVGDPFFDEYRRHRDVSDAFFDVRRDVYVAFHALENVRFFGADPLPNLRDALDRLGF
ncbi:fructosamine kinase family protein [Halostella litorea]|uniref:fructosamine kinase family protein n=1 Tax=Halostella litorea TaxID=2528831 RepID=UPI0010919FED|nr:fructosamine kinase family protein [Halostella litorea]